MADGKVTATMLERLDACGKAAEQLSKTIIRFDASGEKLVKSISELNTFDRMLKEDKSIQTLLDSTNEIKKMLKYFEENLPTFKDTVDASRQEMAKYTDELKESIHLSEGVMADINGLSSLIENLKGIGEFLQNFAKTSLNLEIEDFKESLGGFTTQIADERIRIETDVIEAKTVLDGMKHLLKDHSKDVIESNQSLEKLLQEIKATTQQAISEIGSIKDEFKISLTEEINREVTSTIDKRGTEINNRMDIVLSEMEVIKNDVTNEQRTIRKQFDSFSDYNKTILLNIAKDIEEERKKKSDQKQMIDNLISFIKEQQMQLFNSISEQIDKRLKEMESKLVRFSEEKDSNEELEAIEELLKVLNEGTIEDLEDFKFYEDRTIPSKLIAELYELNNYRLPMAVKKESWTGTYYYIISQYENGIKSGIYYNNGKPARNRGVPSEHEKYYMVYVLKKNE